MLTQDVTKELEAVMEQLQREGKEPTVALVKARMKTPVPMPGTHYCYQKLEERESRPKSRSHCATIERRRSPDGT